VAQGRYAPQGVRWTLLVVDIGRGASALYQYIYLTAGIRYASAMAGPKPALIMNW
jgi:hypothetical protein